MAAGIIDLMTLWLPLNKRERILFCIAFCISCIFLLVVWQAQTLLSACHERYDLINPNARCINASSNEWAYEPMRQLLLDKINESENDGKVSHVSVYFRDMKNGSRFGIGEYAGFEPASLSKVPIMIAMLHGADQDPTILDKTLSFSGALSIETNTDGSGETILPNTPYTIRELIEKMIVNSDNYSYALLVGELNSMMKLEAAHTFNDLDILNMMVAKETDYVSIESYANLFAVLYNAGYLSDTSSQHALDLLSKTTFKDGLVSGVPSGIRVAHKYGHKILPDADQLHDCGLVYQPKATYLLCIMTSGHNETTEASVIADLSQAVYGSVTDMYSK